MENKILIGSMYRHFKGGLYAVQSIAQHSETLEKLVIYQGTDGNYWARPLENFLEKVETNGKMVDRFVPIIPAQTEGA